MRIFLLGLFLGGVSGGIAQHFTGDPQLATAVGAVAAIATWLGTATLIFVFDPE
ncbi:hypothetical protein ABT185_32800 [Streptomyces clavifer]|uniref:hypothetical protein n=1 Tax=Streptomyces clavifer TaxID=68188 RepID=UPI003323ACFA